MCWWLLCWNTQKRVKKRRVTYAVFGWLNLRCAAAVWIYLFIYIYIYFAGVSLAALPEGNTVHIHYKRARGRTEQRFNQLSLSSVTRLCLPLLNTRQLWCAVSVIGGQKGAMLVWARGVSTKKKQTPKPQQQSCFKISLLCVKIATIPRHVGLWKSFLSCVHTHKHREGEVRCELIAEPRAVQLYG